MTEKRNIKALTLSELTKTLADWGIEGYRFDQMFRWLYHEDVAAFSEMTNLSKSLREKLETNFFIGRLQPKAVQESEDGTRKFLFDLEGGQSVESVLIPNGERQTICISTQVGCAMACTFCLTGRLGLTRNLNHFEIVEQVMAVRRAVRSDVRISNIVYMGMGEPLHNFDETVESIKILLDQRGPNFSKNKITVSTSGLVPQMLKFGEVMDVKLAISLTATTDEVRDQLIPINRKYDLKTLLDACRAYPLKGKRRITFEYTLLKDVNDSLEDAKRLVKLLQGIPAKVNLIPFNDFAGSGYQRSDDASLFAFQKYLLDRHVQANIRISRGRDILGACGQLKASLEERKVPPRPFQAGKPSLGSGGRPSPRSPGRSATQ